MTRGYKKTILGILTVAVMFVTYTNFASAYSVQGTQTQATGTFQMPSVNFNLNWIGGLWNTLQGFLNNAGSFLNGNVSINTIGNTILNVPTAAVSGQSTLGGAFQNFDNWLFGVARFHISDFFGAVVSLLVWLLNLAKDIITWALSLVR